MVLSFTIFCSQFSSIFLYFFGEKKMRNVLIGGFIFMSFLVRFLLFELWSISYFSLVNNVLDLAKNQVWFIAKYTVDGNLFRPGFSILKQLGSRGVTPVGRYGQRSPPLIIFFKFLLSPDWMHNKSDEFFLTTTTFFFLPGPFLSCCHRTTTSCHPFYLYAPLGNKYTYFNQRLGDNL